MNPSQARCPLCAAPLRYEHLYATPGVASLPEIWHQHFCRVCHLRILIEGDDEALLTWLHACR